MVGSQCHFPLHIKIFIKVWARKVRSMPEKHREAYYLWAVQRMPGLQRAIATVLAMVLRPCLTWKSSAYRGNHLPCSSSQVQHTHRTEGSSWPGCLPVTCHRHHRRLLPLCHEGSSCLSLRSHKGSKEKCICLSGRAQLQGIPVLPSLYQKVENKLTYLFFIYVHENICNFSLCQIT